MSLQSTGPTYIGTCINIGTYVEIVGCGTRREGFFNSLLSTFPIVYPFLFKKKLNKKKTDWNN